MHDPLAAQTLAVFAEIDRQTAAFQQATGLHCPPGCGKCCEAPTVEVTVLDCLPYAIELHRQNQGDRALQQLATARATATTTCIFYAADATIPGNGRCTIYAWRPALCRLFGFATVRNKQGQPALAACAEHKVTQSDRIAQMQPALANQELAAPSFTQSATQIAELDPALGSQHLPINEAWQQAIERVGLWLQFSQI